MSGADVHRSADESSKVSVDAWGVPPTLAQDPLVVALEAAPVDDEPYDKGDHAASEEGWAAYLAGEAVGLGTLKAELDTTP